MFICPEKISATETTLSSCNHGHLQGNLIMDFSPFSSLFSFLPFFFFLFSFFFFFFFFFVLFVFIFFFFFKCCHFLNFLETNSRTNYGNKKNIYNKKLNINKFNLIFFFLFNFYFFFFFFYLFFV